MLYTLIRAYCVWIVSSYRLDEDGVPLDADRVIKQADILAKYIRP